MTLAGTGLTDDEIMAGLKAMGADIERNLVPVTGADAARQVADAFVRALLGEKRELEKSGGVIPTRWQ